MVGVVVLTFGGMVLWGLWVGRHPNRETDSFFAHLVGKPSSIASAAAPGVVTIEGRAESANDHVTHPLTSEQCIAWIVVVEELTPTPRGASWKGRMILQDSRPFTLRDDTGLARVDLREGVELLLEKHAAWLADAMPDHVRKLLEDNDSQIRDGLVNELNVWTGILREGDKVSVTAWATRPQQPSIYRGGGAGLILSDDEDQRLVLSQGERKRAWMNEDR
jgi:hypothetical protein